MTAPAQELQIARKAAQAGARVVRDCFGEASNARIKGAEKGLVTDADLKAEKAILEILAKESGYGILSEESGLLGSERGPKWVVDPIDGTSNFARGLPFFGVSVALVNHTEFLIGVIIDVIQQKEYYAAKNGGAYCNDEKIIHPPFREKHTPSLFLNHGYRESDRQKFKHLTERLASEFDILKLGTTALELCYVSEGTVDGFICSGDELWDFAAGVVIATEAGCLFSDWNGRKWSQKENHLLFARPEIHHLLVERIKDFQ